METKKDDVLEVSADFLKGFNQGYLLAEHAPELSTQIDKAQGNTERLEGLRAGREQYQLEQQRDKLPSHLRDTPVRDKPVPDKGGSKDRGLER